LARLERIREIDGLRAIAALSVFAHHAFGYAAIVRFTGSGWIGVDLFFVISGYLITTILLGMRGDPDYFKNFYMRRTLRIFPPYYLFLLICFISALFSRHYHMSGKLWAAFVTYSTSLIVVQSWYSSAMLSLPVPANAIEVTWSLSIEELFYLLWAPAVRYLTRKHLVVLVVAVILGAPAIRWYMHQPGQWPEYFFFPARMDALAFGALLALLRSSSRHFRVPGWCVAVSLTACLLALRLSGNPRNNSLFVVFGYTLVALTMALLLGFVLDYSGTDHLLCRALRASLLVRVGTISYMFYLLHLFVLRSFSSVFASVLVSHWALNRTLSFIGSLTVTLLLSGISWRYFESPILSLKSRFGTNRALAVGVAAN
jgi:peptidoglycan/LPS O-acetylase OafA/YrhL